MRRSLLLPLLLLTACGDKDTDTGEEADTDTDTDTASLTYEVVDQGTADAGFFALLRPSVFYFTIEVQAALGGDKCPEQVEKDDILVSLEGNGCTDNNGYVWTGSRTMAFEESSETEAELILMYDNLSAQSETDGIALDGEMRLLATGPDLDEGLWSGTEATGLTITTTDSTGSFPLYYREYALSGDVGSMLLEGGAGELTVSGQVEVVGLGYAGLSGSISSTGSCPREFADSGTLVLTGGNVTTYTFDGAKSCDGCIPFSTDDGLEGEFCDL
ncbi:MAG: hypothetical protein AAFV53_05860 [Myxococcota bacterium]